MLSDRAWFVCAFNSQDHPPVACLPLFSVRIALSSLCATIIATKNDLKIDPTCRILHKSTVIAWTVLWSWARRTVARPACLKALLMKFLHVLDVCAYQYTTSSYRLSIAVRLTLGRESDVIHLQDTLHVPALKPRWASEVVRNLTTSSSFEAGTWREKWSQGIVACFVLLGLAIRCDMYSWVVRGRTTIALHSSPCQYAQEDSQQN